MRMAFKSGIMVPSEEYSFKKLDSYVLMLSQKVKNQMAKQKAPNARRVIVEQ